MGAERYVVWLNQPPVRSFACMGSKAANLARLSQAGFPVPDGFCIATEAYCDFLDTLDPVDAGIELADTRRGLEKAILETPLLPALRQ